MLAVFYTQTADVVCMPTFRLTGLVGLINIIFFSYSIGFGRGSELIHICYQVLAHGPTAVSLSRRGEYHNYIAS